MQAFSTLVYVYELGLVGLVFSMLNKIGGYSSFSDIVSFATVGVHFTKIQGSRIPMLLKTLIPENMHFLFKPNEKVTLEKSSMCLSNRTHLGAWFKERPDICFNLDTFKKVWQRLH